MKLKSMKMDKESQKEYAQPTALTDIPEYPYGLKINLDEKAMKKLGIVALPSVGQKMMLHAEVEVCSVSQYDSYNDSKDVETRSSMDLQITDMALEKPAGKSNPTEKLYGA